MHEDELAELVARDANDKLGLLAASEIRSRESWRGPGKWLMMAAGLAFADSTCSVRSCHDVPVALFFAW